MSVILEFSQITNHVESSIAFLKSCNLYEIDNNKCTRGKSCYIRNTELFNDLMVDRDIWEGEVYNIPMVQNYLFYVQAMDFENNVGHRIENDEIIFLAFDPAPIHFVVSQAIKDVPKVGTVFNELELLLKESVEKNFLINVQWG